MSYINSRTVRSLDREAVESSGCQCVSCGAISMDLRVRTDCPKSIGDSKNHHFYNAAWVSLWASGDKGFLPISVLFSFEEMIRKGTITPCPDKAPRYEQPVMDFHELQAMQAKFQPKNLQGT